MKNMQWQLAAVGTVIGLYCLLVRAEVQYTVIDLGTLGGTYSVGHRVNVKGQVVGVASDAAGSKKVTLFDSSGHGSNVALGVYPSWSVIDINNDGQIVGGAVDSSGHTKATIFDPNGAGNNRSLGALGTSYGSETYNINNNGQVVGAAQDSSHSYQYATLFDPSGNGNNVNLGGLPSGRSSTPMLAPGGGMSWATCINDNGQIVGSAFDSTGIYKATLFDSTGQGNNVNLGTLPGGRSSQPSAINNSGQIAGVATDSAGHSKAVLFDPSGLGNNINLGTLGGSYVESSAGYMNNVGQIVGWSGTVAGSISTYRAVLFDPTGQGNNIDLNTLISPASGWTLRVANGIGDNGWIVGEGRCPTGQEHAFLLKPVPEPATLALLTLGGLIVRRRR